MTLARFPLNPDYGSGCYRRLLRFYALPGAVLGTIDDSHHAMWILLRHDGQRIEAVEADISRGPATSCRGSAAGLRKLVGLPLQAESQAAIATLDRVQNCTHLSDLAAWSLRVAHSGNVGRRVEYQIRVEDDDGTPFRIEIAKAGKPIHNWLVSGSTVIAPEPLAGMPLMRGFMASARTHFQGDDLEAAIMLQRGIWVARGRRHIVDAAPVPLTTYEDMEDACYSYAGEQWRTATSHVGYVRDVTDGILPHPLPDHISRLLSGYDHDPS
ncbi:MULTISPECIES: DUF2889 domain-containing protein [Sphingobium]|uniref:DUF2889 domain-containing protein n=1 Tax=Sphingobium TaxID=165695 RepID=UPI00159BF4DF|nr:MULTISPECIES: DUF2889 domain-containing protein [unclassified Sphingobium]